MSMFNYPINRNTSSPSACREYDMIAMWYILNWCHTPIVDAEISLSAVFCSQEGLRLFYEKLFNDPSGYVSDVIIRDNTLIIRKGSPTQFVITNFDVVF